MAYYTSQLISNAYYASGIVSRDYENVTGQQESDGLIFLNDLLADKTVDNGLIPYYQQYDFNAVAGQERYFIEDLISVDTFVFFIDSVRYSTTWKGRREYFGQARADDIRSLPGSWHLERELGGASIYIYFKPDLNYPLTIWGQFRLASVTLNQDLELTLDRFYINYLKFDLAARLCNEYSFNIPPGLIKTLKKYEEMISKKSGTIDLRMQKLSTLRQRGGINYGQVNLGKGWTTS